MTFCPLERGMGEEVAPEPTTWPFSVTVADPCVVGTKVMDATSLVTEHA
ncbi:MAG TPA: hypothetical protein VJ604_14355 [Geomonas sp.]|nr:hypothetical protein [Geomonas sp.]HJV36254.1 hypothetical protein [Geomonas sp.]